MNNLRYRIKKNSLDVIAVQDFDLYNYKESDWLENYNGEPFEVNSQEQAEYIVTLQIR
jgi:hypothetical protein